MEKEPLLLLHKGYFLLLPTNNNNNKSLSFEIWLYSLVYISSMAVCVCMDRYSLSILRAYPELFTSIICSLALDLFTSLVLTFHFKCKSFDATYYCTGDNYDWQFTVNPSLPLRLILCLATIHPLSYSSSHLPPPSLAHFYSNASIYITHSNLMTLERKVWNMTVMKKLRFRSNKQTCIL